MEERTYDLNEVAMMSGLTTRTLRNYLTQGILKGNKIDGVWRFTFEELENFFADPFAKEGMRIKRSSAVFDFLADRKKKEGRTCVVLDKPVSRKEGDRISAFFCKAMENASDISFSYSWDDGQSRVVLSGNERQVMEILKAYDAAMDL